MHFNRDHGFCGFCPPEKQISTALQSQDIISHLPPTTSLLLNDGAASLGGGIYDPTHPLLTALSSSFGALLIDPNANTEFFSAYPRRSNIRIVHDYIWSESIVSDILVKFNVSQDFTLLKVDVDSYECFFLDAILPEVSKVLQSFGYILVEVDYWDVIYVRREIAETVHMQVRANDAVAYEHGFANDSCFAFCRDNAKLYNSRIYNAIKNDMNQSNFPAYTTNVMNEYAPRSIKTNLRHPFTIAI